MFSPRLLYYLVPFVGLRLIFWLTTFPNPDEAYYWLWGQHPALSYYDHPPFHAWVQGLFTAVLGRSHFVLRLPNLLSNGLLLFVYYRLCENLYGEKARPYFGMTVLVLLASPLYFLFLALAWQDHWLIAFSLWAAYGFMTFATGYLADGRGRTRQLYGTAAVLGLALLCKYNAVFMAAGMIATLIADRRLRPLWRDRRLYVAGAIVLAMLSPVFAWNVMNHFQSFGYYINRSVNTGSFGIKLAPGLNFLLFSVLMVSPVYVYVMCRHLGPLFFARFGWGRSRFAASGLTRLSGLAPLSETNPHMGSVYLTLALWTFGLSTVCLTVIAFLSAGLYYWNIIAYLLLLPLLPPFLVVPVAARWAAVRPSRLFHGAQAYGLLFATLLVVHYCVLPLSALVSADADPDSRMLWGWETVAAEIKALAKAGGDALAHNADRALNHNQLADRVFVITTDYRSASALAYQLQSKNVTAISDRVDQFDFWPVEKLRNRSSLPPVVVHLADDWHPFPANGAGLRRDGAASRLGSSEPPILGGLPPSAELRSKPKPPLLGGLTPLRLSSGRSPPPPKGIGDENGRLGSTISANKPVHLLRSRIEAANAPSSIRRGVTVERAGSTLKSIPIYRFGYWIKNYQIFVER